MAFQYIHGIETVQVDNSTTPFQVVRTAVIGLVGTAPLGDKNKLILIKNETDAAKLGARIGGFTIPKALKAIYAQGPATVIVVNVFDPALHVTTVTAESITITKRKAKLAFPHVGSTAPIVTNNAATTTYVAGTDYTIDEFGVVTILAPLASIAESSVLKVTYQKVDQSQFTAALINGTINTAGDRSGFKCFADAYQQFKFKPKILIAPGFSTLNAVAASMVIEGDKYRAHPIIDAPIGTTINNAISGRGFSGAINFNVYNKRVELCYPHLKVYNDVTDSEELQPYSQFLAGIYSSVHNEFGYWFSASNKSIKGILGTETNVSWAPNDSETDANKLNEIGITTVGNGLSVWGNRNSSFPDNLKVTSFNAVQITSDILDESVELSAIKLIDLPVTNGWIDTVTDSVNEFIRTLISRGALIDGSNCFCDRSKNPPSQIALGKILWSIKAMSPIPGETMIFEKELDVNLLKNLFGTAA